MPTSPPGSQRTVGHFNSDIGMTTRSALIARKQLNPYEEALAVQAMLDRGFTHSGADVLGWSIKRVAGRVKILELPDRAQQMIGNGSIPLSAVDQLRAIGQVAPALLDAVVAYLDDGNEWAAERLSHEPGWVLDAAVRDGAVKAFASYLDTVSSYEISALRLGKRAEDQFAKAEKLHNEVSPHAYGAPPMRFEQEDIDQARAAGVLIEFERGRPVIVDRSLYRELAKGAVKRTVRSSVSGPPKSQHKRRRTASSPGASRWIPSLRPVVSATGSCGSLATRRTGSTLTWEQACSMGCRPSIRRAWTWRGSSC
jgi:hypothetical protein